MRRALSRLRGILRKLFADRYADASYMADWREAFCESEQLSIELCNITNLLEFRVHRHKIKTYDLIIVLHSAAGDRMGILNRTTHWFHDRRGALAVFVGNGSTSWMKRSRSSMSRVLIRLHAVQIEIGRLLYEGCTATVLPMPHALNPAVYKRMPEQARTIDIGFVGDLYDRLIGDQERTRIVEFVANDGARHGLRCDVSVNECRELNGRGI